MKIWAFFLILLAVLMPLVMAPETALEKDYVADSDYGKITLTESHVVVSEYELYSNSRDCRNGIYCYYEINVSLKEPGVLVSGVEFTGNKKPVLNHKNYVVTLQNVLYDVNDYKEVCALNKSVMECHDEVTGTHKEYRLERVLTEYRGETLPAGDYILRGEAEKDYNDAVEWIINVNGVRFTEWAPWAPGDLAYNNQPYYTLNNTLADITSYVDMTSLSGTYTLDANGKIAGCVNSTVSTELVVNDASIFDWHTGDYAVSYWLRSKQANGTVRRHIWGEVNKYSIWSYDCSGALSGYAIGVKYGANPTICFNENTADAVNIFNNSFHHIVVMRNSSVTHVYVDGQQKANTTSAYDAYDIDIGLMNILNADGGEQLIASLDELGFWNRSLTFAEITKLYNSGSGFAYPFSTPALNISFVSQIPADITAFNLLSQNYLNITYSVSGGTSPNMSNATIYFKSNSSASETELYVNGVAYSGYSTTTLNTYIDGNSAIFQLSDNQIYPGTYNFQPRKMESYAKVNVSLSSGSNYIKMEFYNFSSSKNYNIFEIYAENITTSSAPMQIYYCNTSYTTGNPAISGNCAPFAALLNTNTFNHTHGVYSKHHVITISQSGGYVSGIKSTATSYILLRGNTGGWNAKAISNVSRTSAMQTTSNNGNTWADYAGTVDSHIHQYSGTDRLSYFACVNDATPSSACSDLRQDLLDIAGLFPSSPVITAPTNSTYEGINNITVSWLSAVSPNGYSIDLYNVTALTTSYGFYSFVGNTTGNSLYWNLTGIPYDSYIIEIKACDSFNQCSYGYSEVFKLQNVTIETSAVDISTTSGVMWQGILFIVWVCLLLFSLWLLKTAMAMGSLIIGFMGVALGLLTAYNIPAAITSLVNNDIFIRIIISAFFLLIFILILVNSKKGSEI